MGLSFHYSGNIAKPELLPELMDEVQDICTVYNWKYTIYERQFPEDPFGKPGYDQNIYGISFTPPGSETISICFLSNGRMSNKVLLAFYGKTKEQQESKYLYMLSVKTQYSSVESHQFIIQLFRYLNKKYFTGFRLTDEGQYWETNDEKLLKENFKRYADLINGFVSVYENFPMMPGENTEEYLERLIKEITYKRKLGG